MAGREGAADASSRPWPHCPAIGGTCLAYNVGRCLGPEIATAVTEFIFNARDGARLTLQRNHEDFTLQVTGAVQRGTHDTFDLSKLRDLHRRLDLLTNRGTA